MATTTTTTPAPGQFPWESALASGPFWDPLTTPSSDPQKNLRNIAQTFPRIFSASEMSQMPLDASLSKADKIALLSSIISTHISALGNPENLDESDWAKYGRLQFCLAICCRESGDLNQALEVLRHTQAVTKKRNPEQPEIASLDNNIAWTLKLLGRNAEAEDAAREALPPMRERKDLGPDSPQVLGLMRLLVEVVAKQGREEEAGEIVKETRDVIELLRKGRFAKYEREEIQALEEVERQIPGWVGEGSGKD
jgi:tetratricopeptide (TPR) repeat protein